MIDIEANTPTELWAELGLLFFSKEFENIIDIRLGDRRFVSLTSNFLVKKWSQEWTGKALFSIVGYSPKGYKRHKLWATYINPNALSALKSVIQERGDQAFMAAGMNFNMNTVGKGGCLSSLHIIKNKKEWLIVLQGKIAEIPRKFVADMILVAELIKYLDIPKPPLVKFMYSAVYFSIVGLRAYVPVLGQGHLDFHDLPILGKRNYQVGTQKSIKKYQKFLEQRYGKGIWIKGMFDKIDPVKGELE